MAIRSIVVAVLHVKRQVIPAGGGVPPFEPVEDEQQPGGAAAADLGGQALLRLFELRLAQKASDVEAKDVVGFVLQ